MIFKAPFTPAVKAIRDAILSIATYWGDGTALARLFKNNPSIDANTVLGSIIEADFSGYAAQGVNDVPLTVLDPLTGQIGFVGNPVSPGFLWIADSGMVTPQTVYGAYFTSGDGTKLLGAAKFDVPIVLTAPDNFVAIGSPFWWINPAVLGG